MPSVFTPPTVQRVPPVLPETRGLQFALFRHFAPTYQGENLFKMADGTYQLDAQPQLLSNPDPVRADLDLISPVITYYGGHSYTVTDTEAAALTAAGYGAYLA